MQLKKAKIKGYAFVIKSTGMPRIDNPSTVPDDAWNTLTKEQQDYANRKVSAVFRKI